MINRCKFLNIILNACGITDGGCLYMADPQSCPNYDEDSDSSYVKSYQGKSVAEVAKLESQRIEQETESVLDFTSRLESELDGMGIKVTKAERPVEKFEKEAPDWF